MVNYLPEQLSVIKSRENSIRVHAGAGTGKTTTLIGYANERPRERLLYLAFNKSIQMEASERFGKNTRCRTPHSIAYGAYGALYKEEDKLSNNMIRSSELAREMKISVPRAAFAIETLKAFLYSTDQDVSVEHAFKAKLSPVLHEDAVAIAQQVWKWMYDLRKKNIPMTHDGYLKMFQLSGKAIQGYDRVLLDEAQDANPVIANLVSRFNGGVVLVGDQNQAIYGFRGAEDAMSAFEHAAPYQLATSFRFGPAVADIANVIIEHAIGDSMRIVGRGKETTIDEPVNRFADSSAFIARTNGRLIDEAMSYAMRGRSVPVVGGVDSLKLSVLMDVYHLENGNFNSISAPWVKQFKSFKEMVDMADQVDDVEIKALVNVVKQYGDGTPEAVDMLYKHVQAYTPSTKNQCVLTTAHKSKGLEFDHVSIADDFHLLCEDDIDRQEANLLYVAVTRAKKNLVLNSDIRTFVSRFRNESATDPAKNKMRLAS
ncbi:UvrD-helicase domain-containing protein [Ferrovum sp.]|uniref:UvrD-helicase domain-containing protein n=1 Tax=Ferrovum sp. TaxID=2609467 RepID=UPI00260787BB|nr:UvrD-helicase domain-containing protein [Ferrovum sp.]